MQSSHNIKSQTSNIYKSTLITNTSRLQPNSFYNPNNVFLKNKICKNTCGFKRCHVNGLLSKKKRLHLGNLEFLKGDKLLKENKLTEASQSFSKAAQLTGKQISEDRLESLIISLIEFYEIEIIEKTSLFYDITRLRSLEAMSQDSRSVLKQGLTCSWCNDYFHEPVTIICGHTYCRYCIQEVEFCKNCDLIITRFNRKNLNEPPNTFDHYNGFGLDVMDVKQHEDLKVNVLLVNLLLKLIEGSFQEKLYNLKKTCWKIARKGDLSKVFELITKGLDDYTNSCYLLLMRAGFNYCLARYDEVLLDTESVLFKKPLNIQALIIKARALKDLQRYEDSIGTYIRCLSIHPNLSIAKKELTMVIQESLTSVNPSTKFWLSSCPSHRKSCGISLKQLSFNINNPDYHYRHLHHSISNINMQNISKRKSLSTACSNYQPNILTDSESFREKDRIIPLVDDGQSDDNECMKMDEESKTLQAKTCILSNLFCRKTKRTASGSILHKNVVLENPTVNDATVDNVEELSSSLSSGIKMKSTIFTYDEISECSSSLTNSLILEENIIEAISEESSSPINVNMSSDESLLLNEDEEIKFNKSNITAEDVECTLCLRMLLEPITTNCGHVFCLDCLYRSLDYNPYCPLCKESLNMFLALRPKAITESISSIIEECLTDDLIKRKESHELELSVMKNIREGGEVPIFICTFAYPSLPCPLHVFEPRYRLMMRRCQQINTNQFGMCVPVSDNNTFANFGVILEIQDLKFFRDGRSIIKTIGRRRFKVLSRGERDGYSTAKITHIEDQHVSSDKISELNARLSTTYVKAEAWFSSISTSKRDSIIDCYGPFPQSNAGLPFSHSIPAENFNNITKPHSMFREESKCSDNPQVFQSNNPKPNVNAAAVCLSNSTNICNYKNVGSNPFSQGFDIINQNRQGGLQLSQINQNSERRSSQNIIGNEVNSTLPISTTMGKHQQEVNLNPYNSNFNKNSFQNGNFLNNYIEPNSNLTNISQSIRDSSLCDPQSTHMQISAKIASNSCNVSSHSESIRKIHESKNTNQDNNILFKKNKNNYIPNKNILQLNTNVQINSIQTNSNLNQYNSFGTDGPDWMWYLISIMPLDQKVILSLLSQTLLEERLKTVERVLAVLSQKPWK